ncbi:hypothetical protein ACTFIW_009326 [Dictyostelium discoideum]
MIIIFENSLENYFRYSQSAERGANNATVAGSIPASSTHPFKSPRNIDQGFNSHSNKNEKTLEFIQPHKLKNFIYIATGKGKHWIHERTRSNNLTTNKIKPIIPQNMKKDHEVNIDYANLRFHNEHFEWGYKCINYDLSRTFAYRNIMALIIHNIWGWICNQLYSEEPSEVEKLSYSNLLNKWYKLATLEYIKKAKDLKINLSKDPNNFKDPNDYLKQITKLRKLTCKVYCIPESVLPNIISFDQFI